MHAAAAVCHFFMPPNLVGLQDLARVLSNSIIPRSYLNFFLLKMYLILNYLYLFLLCMYIQTQLSLNNI